MPLAQGSLLVKVGIVQDSLPAKIGNLVQKAALFKLKTLNKSVIFLFYLVK